ncbi:hypothetical protein [Micromonospora sp. NPDC005087]|uniref:hypothetical protein n=1 Tax=Micromonospora sp. NPDC005087 TaxID=3364225 RepID=UPI0036D01188
MDVDEIFDFEETRDLVTPAVVMTKIGEAIELSQGPVVLHIEGDPTEVVGCGKLKLYWDGRGLVGSFEADVPIGQIHLGDDFRSTTLSVTEANLSTAKINAKIERRADVSLFQPSLFPEEERLEFQYRVTSFELELASEDRGIKKVIAHLLNVPPYLGMKIGAARPNGRGRFFNRGRLELLSDGWRVTVDYLHCWAIRDRGFWNEDEDEDEDEFDDALDILNALGDASTIGGTFITHAIRMERAKGSLFNRKQALSALGRLEVFLRFAFGGPGQPICVYGFGPKGQTSWKSLPSSPDLPRSGGQRRARSWLPLAGDETEGARTSAAQELNSQLSSMFAYWMNSSEDEKSDFKKMITRAVEWYTASLEAPSKNQCIVLAQASLEVLSNYCLQSKLHLSEKSQQKLEFSDQLKVTLSVLGIDIKVPSSFVAHRGRPLTGPSAVTRARNSVVHPRSGYEDLSDDEIEEARTLSLWYVERIILQLLQYRGLYWNRIERKITSLARS